MFVDGVPRGNKRQAVNLYLIGKSRLLASTRIDLAPALSCRSHTPSTGNRTSSLLHKRTYHIRTQHLPPKPLRLQQLQIFECRPGVREVFEVWWVGEVAQVGEVGYEWWVCEERCCCWGFGDRSGVLGGGHVSGGLSWGSERQGLEVGNWRGGGCEGCEVEEVVWVCAEFGQ